MEMPFNGIFRIPETTDTPETRARDLRYITDNGLDSRIDPDGIGNFLGAGAQHTAYEYGTQVIKIPNGSAYVRNASLMLADQALAEEHIPAFLPHREIVSSGNAYTIVVDDLRQAEFFKVDFLDQDNLKTQLQDLLHRNQKLRNAKGYTLDLVGRNAAVQFRDYMMSRGEIPREELFLGNIVAIGEQVKIMDLEFMRLPNLGNDTLSRYILNRTSIIIQRQFLKRYFGLDM